MTTKVQAHSPQYAVLMQLLRSAEVIWNASQALFARWDLSPSQFNVLNLLYEQPKGISQIELARQLLMHRSNATGLIDRLEARGLVERHPTPGDRRAYLVKLSANGQLVVKEILPVYLKAIEKLWEGCPQGESRQIIAVMKHLASQAETLEAVIRNQVKPHKIHKETP